MSRQWIEVTFNYKWFDPRGREHSEKLVLRDDGDLPARAATAHGAQRVRDRAAVGRLRRQQVEIVLVRG
jgi:hypothetical protein